MVPEWLNCPSEAPAPDIPAIAVAIGVTDAPRSQLHIGIVHVDEGRPARVLDLGWYGLTGDEAFPHREIPFWWVPLRIIRDTAEALAGLCRRIAKRAALGYAYPYAVLYEGGRIRADGLPDFNGREIGFTCATFALAVLEHAGITLLQLETWQSRPADAVWHAAIVDGLRRTQARFRIPQAHIDAVAAELGCARFRPEEVAAGCAKWPPASTFADVQPSAQLIFELLLPGATR